MTKPKVGIFSLTCCEGCQIEVLNLEDVLLDIVEKIDILSFRLAKAEDINTDFDIVFLEGSVSTEEDMEKTKKLREKARMLVALGSCACTGGVQAQKNFTKSADVEKAVFGASRLDIKNTTSVAVSEIVPVDYQIRGCPIDNTEFASILKELLLGRMPYQREWPVCVECKIRENHCLLEDNKICLGPVTYGGCNAVCPSNNLYCIGCRGIMDDSNIKAFVELMKEQKHPVKDIRDAFQMIYGKNPRLKEVR